MRTFVFIFYGRTGSSWLLQTFSRVPRVLVPAFEPVERWAWDAGDAAKLAWLEHALSPPERSDAPERIAAWARRLAASPQFRQVRKASFDTVGFKMTLGAFDDKDLLAAALEASGARVVFLERDNRIKHALSLYRAHEEGKDQFGPGGEQPPTKVNLRRFDRWLQHSAAVHAELTEFRERFRITAGESRVLTVAYEEFGDDGGKAAVIERVARFLEVDPARARHSELTKVTPDDLSVAVVNFEALERRYRAGPFARFLDDRSEPPLG